MHRSRLTHRLLPIVALALLSGSSLAQTAPAPSPAPKAPAAPAAPATPAPLDSQPSASDDAAPLPTFDEIWPKVRDASGGQAAMDAMKFVTTKGFMQMPAMGLKGAMSTQVKLPDHTLTSIELPGMGTMLQGTSGDVGWTIDPMRGPALVEGSQLAQQRMLEKLTRNGSDPRTVFKEITIVGLKDFAGRPCYEVAFKSDDMSFTSFYDAATFLTAGLRMTMASPMGDIPAEMVLSDYKAFEVAEGVSMQQPTRTTMKVMGQEQVVVIEEMSFAPIDDAVFALPPAISALIAAKEQQAQQPKDAASTPAAGDATAPTAPASGDQPGAKRPRPRPKQDQPSTAPTP